MRRRFRIPREEETQKTGAFEYVRRSWPEGTTDQIRRLFDNGQVEADGIVVTRPDNPLAPETVVDIDADVEGKEVFAVPDANTLLWGEEWVVVDKPVGIPGRIKSDDPTEPVRFLADVLGLDRDTVTPVWPMPTNAGGPWLLAKTPQVADRIGEAIVTGAAQTTWVAIVARPEQNQGLWATDKVSLPFATSRTRDGLAELQLSPDFQNSEGRPTLVEDLLEAAAGAGFPVIGDGANGGYLCGGGIRLRLQAIYGTDEFGHSWAPPRQWWPEEPVVPEPEPVVQPQRPEADVAAVEELFIDDGAVDRLEGGHPWVLRHGLRQSIDDLAAGQPVDLVGPEGSTGTFALVDGTGPVAARVFSDHRGEAAARDEEAEIRLDEAIGRRLERFQKMGETDIFRVVHGEADGLPGLFIDRIGPTWCVSVTARCALALCEPVYRALHQMDPTTAILEVKHLQTLPSPDDVSQGVRIVEPGSSLSTLDEFIAREDDLRFRVQVDDGVYLDVSPVFRNQRRRAVEAAQPGTHWLDVRCRTGAFCAALVRAGAEVTNVDPHRRYFRALDTTFELNGLVDERRRDVDADVFDFLEDGDEVFDGILVDLSVARRRSAGEVTPRKLLELCIGRLRSSGRLFVTRPVSEDIDLRELVDGVATDAQRTVYDVDTVGAASDFPSMDGFPEGDPFRGLWATCS